MRPIWSVADMVQTHIAAATKDNRDVSYPLKNSPTSRESYASGHSNSYIGILSVRPSTAASGVPNPILSVNGRRTTHVPRDICGFVKGRIKRHNGQF